MTNKLILLVEDNPDDETLTIMALRENNILNEIQVVRDGAEALDYLMCRGEYSDRDPKILPQLVILDLNLPKISGLEVLKQIRKATHTQFLPVVILTTSKDENDLVTGYKNGANSYVRKPVNFEEFATAVKQVGLYWLILNENMNY